MDLKQLIIDTKSVWMDYPGLEGFEVEVAILSRRELIKLQKRCTVTKFDKQVRSTMESFDQEKFVKEFADAVVKDWRGLTLDYLQSLILINTEGLDLSEELPYSKENAELIVAGSQEFDAWLNEVVFDLDNFRDGGKRKDLE